MPRLHKHHPPEWPALEDSLRVTPYAWHKILWFLHACNTEVGGWGISADDDPLLVVDFRVIKQACSIGSIEFDSEALARYSCDLMDEGLDPAHGMRIWIHTHPGNSADPSGTDRDTYRKLFAHSDWGVMMIVSASHRAYAQLRTTGGPGANTVLPVEVDWSIAVDPAYPLLGDGDEEEWTEQLSLITRKEVVAGKRYRGSAWESGEIDDDWWLRGESYGGRVVCEETGLSWEATLAIEAAIKLCGLTVPRRGTTLWNEYMALLWNFAIEQGPKPCVDHLKEAEEQQHLDGLQRQLAAYAAERGLELPDLYTTEWWGMVDTYSADIEWHGRHDSEVAPEH